MITIATNMMVRYCREYTNINVAHFISLLNLLAYNPVNNHPIFNTVARIKKGNPSDGIRNGSGNKAATHM
jgi:hypothetical protein